jgi:RHS repeat-associated protein
LTKIDESIAGVIERDFDLLDRLTEEATPEGTVTYTHDGANRRATMTVAGQTQVSYGYDNADRLTSITEGSTSVGFTYDSADRRSVLTLPNGVTVESTYDTASQVTALTYKLGGSTLGDLTYTYDSNGNRTAVGGSWTRTTLPTALTSATYNAGNQIATWGGTSFTYDDNGNLTSDGSKAYTWNARNELTGLSGGASASFQYDGVGRRRAKTISGTTTGFLYDGLNAVQELSGGSPSANILAGLGLDEWYRRVDATTTRDLLTDVLGSTVALANTSGAVQTEYTYGAFGGTTRSGGSTTNPSGFTGREDDGTGLYQYRSRFYDPSRQRFLTEDPIGYGGGPNLYSYVNNAPVDLADPLGLCPGCTVLLANPYVAAGAAAGASAATLGAAAAGKAIGNWLADLANKYAQRGKQNVRDSQIEGMTPNEIDAMSKDPNRPKNWDQRLKKHQKGMGDRHSRQSKGSSKGGKGGGPGGQGSSGGSSEGGGPGGAAGGSFGGFEGVELGGRKN